MLQQIADVTECSVNGAMIKISAFFETGAMICFDNNILNKSKNLLPHTKKNKYSDTFRYVTYT